jgi:hypothetical protein
MNQIIASFDKDFIIDQISKADSGLQAFSAYLIDPMTNRVLKDVRKAKTIVAKDLDIFDKFISNRNQTNPYYIINIQKIKISDSLTKVFPVRSGMKYIYMWSTGNQIFNTFNYNTLKENKDFSYLLYNNKNFHAFINEANKFYVDNKLNFSTIPFSTGKAIAKGSVYELNLKFRKPKQVE